MLQLLTSKSADCHVTLRNACAMRARTYANSIRRLNVPRIATRLGRDFSNSIIPAQAHKNAHNFATTHASGFKFAGRSVQRSY